jgi:large subunit ribosomal protein LX
MKPFRLTGHFQMGNNKQQTFVKQFAAPDEETVRERLYSELGSRHGVTRRQIEITKVEVIGNDEDLDPIVRHVIEKSGA